MSTRAIQSLKQNNVIFDIVKYEHDEQGAVSAALKTGFALEKTIKTLVAQIHKKQ